MKAFVPSKFPIDRASGGRVVVEMIGEESSEFFISVRPLAELMEHFVHKMLIQRPPCDQLFPQDLIAQHSIHHRRISRHQMGTTGDCRRETQYEPSALQSLQCDQPSHCSLPIILRCHHASRVKIRGGSTSICARGATPMFNPGTRGMFGL